jgi:hypothetical protein
MIVFLIATLGAWGATHRVACFIEQDLLGEDKRQKLQEKFEAWWCSVAAKAPREFVVGILQQLSSLLDMFFGPRLFSKRAFKRTGWISLGLLLITVTLSELSGVGVHPWETYEGVIKGVRPIIAAQEKELAAKTGPEAEAKRKATETLSRFVEKCDKPWWEILYCAIYYGGLITGTAIAFFITTAISRMTLAEIVASGRATTAICLLTLNFYLCISILGIFMLWTETLASPLMWCGLLMTGLLSMASPYWVVASTFNGGLAAWIFGHTLLRMTAIMVILPCLATMLSCIVVVCALRARQSFHRICCTILLKCATQRSVSFIVGSLGLVGVTIAIVCRLLIGGH